MNLITKDTNTEVKVNPDIFDYAFNEGLVHQAVVTFMNNARSGNSAQKTRAEVRGGGKKPWSQKGTGRARAGTIRSPLWRSGGVIFAAKKADYSQKLNKKMYKRAIRSIISELQRQGNMLVVSDFTCSSLKTKDFIAKMKGFGVENALIILKDIGENEYYGSRNLAEFSICDVYDLDPVILLKHKCVLITQDAIKILEDHLQ